MPRKTFRRDEMECLHQGLFNSLYRVETAAGPREIVAHNESKSNLGAAKMLAICLREGAKLKQSDQPRDTLVSVVSTLRATGLHNWQVLFLAVDRPVTYFELPVALTSNNQIEIPGGVSEGSESEIDTAIREAIEEYGLDGAHDIIQHAPLITYPAAHDAGTNAEIYAIRMMLVSKPAKPPRREGIDPNECRMIPLLDAVNYLEKRGRQGVLVQHLAIEALSLLGLELLGGWNALK